MGWLGDLFSEPPLVLRGSSGDRVKELQYKLNRREGFSLDVDGLFGPKTDDAVRKYQAENGLKVDGIVGSKTRAALRRWW